VTRVDPAASAAEARIAVPVSVVWTEPAAARDIDEPAVRDQPDVRAWTRALDLAARHGLHGRSVTQALLGERVQVIAERDGWSEIRLPEQPSSLSDEGYPGWVPSSHLVAARSEPTTIHASLFSALVVRSAGSTPIDLSFGTALPVVAHTAAVTTLRHPDGSDIRVPTHALRLLDEPALPSAAVDAARLFTDLPYLWGGLSGNGVDCSGLVHLSYRSLGIVVPRDAADQERAAHALDLDDAEPGDTVYFAHDTGVHHVGLVIDTERMLHSPRTGTSVRVQRIDTPDYEGERLLARRFPIQPKPKELP
jgi:cell wall-associated NlpC family hydrolase